MKFAIKFTSKALSHLRGYRKFEQKTIIENIKKQLSYEPLKKTKKRKPLRQNPLSRWRL